MAFLRNLPFAILAVLWFGLTFVFALGYENASIERYYLVPVMIAIVWVALALDAVWRRTRSASRGSRRRRGGQVAVGGDGAWPRCLVVVLLLPVPGASAAAGPVRRRPGPLVDGRTFAALDPNAVIVSWWNYSTPLWYGQFVEGKRPDVTIIDDRNVLDEGYGTAQNAIDAYLGKRPVYLIRLDRDLPAYRARYHLERVAAIPAHRRVRCTACCRCRDRSRGAGEPGVVERRERAGPAAPVSTAATRVPELSYFFPAHNEAENIEALVAEALEVLPTLAERFEIIAVDDGSRDGTAALADRLAGEHPEIVRAVHHAVNQGYGAALRSGLRGRRDTRWWRSPTATASSAWPTWRAC